MAPLRGKIGLLFKPTARPSLYLYLGLRLLQLGATTLTLSYFCSLIGWHKAHYCSERFYKNQCLQFQQDFARVPTLYIIFVATYSFMILSIFGLSYQRLSSFLSSKGSITLSDCGADNSNHGDSIAHDAFHLLKRCGRALGSAPRLTLVIDATTLTVLSFCLNKYWTSIIRPNHMHPGSGYSFPVCWLFESLGYVGDLYWKNLRVEKQRCMDNLISFYSTVGVVSFTLLLVVVDAFYLQHDWSSKKALEDDLLVEAPKRRLLVDTST